MAQQDNRASRPNYPPEGNGSGYPSVPSRIVSGTQQQFIPTSGGSVQGDSASATYERPNSPYQYANSQPQQPQYSGYEPAVYPVRQGTGVDAYGRAYPVAGRMQPPYQPGQATRAVSPGMPQPQAARSQMPSRPVQGGMQQMQQGQYQSLQNPSQYGSSYQMASNPPMETPQAPQPPHGHFAQRPSPYDAKNSSGVVQRSAVIPDKEKTKGGKSRAIIFACLGLVLGAVLGVGAMLLFRSSPGAPIPVAGILDESQLGTVVGSYRYNGEVHEITARDAIMGAGSLSSARRSDGTYETPSADDVLSYARNSILAQLVKDNGIEVSADEVAQYALNLVGSSDADAVAAYFGMEPADAQRLLGEAAAVAKLRQSVVGSTVLEPAPPEPPVDGATEVGTPAYADYIIGLLGSNWDASAQTWANTANPYYEALKDEVFAPGSASYDSAQLAYSIARQEYEAAPSPQQQWFEYLNAYLDEGSVVVNTLRA